MGCDRRPQFFFPAHTDEIIKKESSNAMVILNH